MPVTHITDYGQSHAPRHPSAGRPRRARRSASTGRSGTTGQRRPSIHAEGLAALSASGPPGRPFSLAEAHGLHQRIRRQMLTVARMSQAAEPPPTVYTGVGVHPNIARFHFDLMRNGMRTPPINDRRASTGGEGRRAGVDPWFLAGEEEYEFFRRGTGAGVAVQDHAGTAVN
jgi:hypothetical protein